MSKQTQPMIPFYMTPELAIEKLKALPIDDEKRAHVEAEEILCELLRSQGPRMAEVATAFDAAVERCGFWYS